MLDEYNVSLQTITGEWESLRQVDRHLYELSPWSVVALSTDGLPAGEYRLALILYERESGERVSGDIAGGEASEFISLLRFEAGSSG